MAELLPLSWYMGCVLEYPIVKHFHQFLYTSWYARIDGYGVYHHCCTPLFSMAADLRLTSICVHMYNSITTTTS